MIIFRQVDIYTPLPYTSGKAFTFSNNCSRPKKKLLKHPHSTVLGEFEESGYDLKIRELSEYIINDYYYNIKHELRP